MLRVSGVGSRRRTRLHAFKNVLLSCLGLGTQLDDSDVYELDIDFDFGENFNCLGSSRLTIRFF